MRRPLLEIEPTHGNGYAMEAARALLRVENELVKGEWTDELVYALLEREWRAD